MAPVRQGALWLLCATLAAPASARADDPWFGRDKALHFSASGALAGGGYALASTWSDETSGRLWTGAAIALSAGAAKELYDLTGRGHPSWRDMAWNAVGTGTGLLVAWGIDTLLARRRHAGPVARASPLFEGTLWTEELQMDAIELLEQQHREVEELFERYESLGDRAIKSRKQIFETIGDKFAVHAKIEEEIFYPATKAARTEELLQEAVEEHLSVKRICADLLAMEPDDPQFDAKVSVLKEQVEHHVEEEEEELFPNVRKILDQEELEDLGMQMQELAEEILSEGEPRKTIPSETEEAAPI